MIRVKVNSIRSALSDAIRRKVASVASKSSAYVVERWRAQVAASKLSGAARRRYSEDITPYNPPRIGAYISDKVAILLERGWKSFDMKPGLLAGRLRRVIPLNGGKDLRTVSVKSPSGSWIHPGYEGAHLTKGIAGLLRGIVETALKNGSP